MKSALLLAVIINFATAIYPVAIFHGIGRSCSDVQEGVEWILENLDGVYVKCIETGAEFSSWTSSFKSQFKNGCDAINADPNFHKEFSILGFSQGALLGRMIIEACDMPGVVKRFISVGGPHMGVASIPHCEGGALCDMINTIAGAAVYHTIPQQIVGPAGYFKDMDNYDKYLEKSILAEINNEKSYKTYIYKQRFSSLEKLVLIKFSKDKMIIPKETAWFQFYDNNLNVMKLENSDFYKHDYIGLRHLVESGKVEFVELEGEHLEFEGHEMMNYMIYPLK